MYHVMEIIIITSPNLISYISVYTNKVFIEQISYQIRLLYMLCGLKSKGM